MLEIDTVSTRGVGNRKLWYPSLVPQIIRGGVFSVLSMLMAIMGMNPIVGFAKPGEVPPRPKPHYTYYPKKKPITVKILDGYVLTIGSSGEIVRRVHPLTTASSSRDWVFTGHYFAQIRGSGKKEITSKTVEVGYEISCGVTIGNDGVVIGMQWGENSSDSQGYIFPSNAPAVGPNSPGETLPIQFTGQAKMVGQVMYITMVDKKEFKGNSVSINTVNYHTSVDKCIGQSFTRSYVKVSLATDSHVEVAMYYGRVVND